MENKGPRTEVISTNELLEKVGDGKIEIPDLQREYVWGQKEWRILWNDLQKCYRKIVKANSSKGLDFDGCPQHFMGALNLEESKEEGKYSQLLDGQQRLTTVMILIDCLQGMMNVSPSDRKTNPLDSKWVKWGDGNEADEAEKKADEAKKKYMDIYGFFAEQIINLKTSEDVGNELYEDLLNIVLNRFFWIWIETQDDPHLVFEGINASGKNIEYADFILNFILELNDKDRSKSNAEIKNEWKTLLGYIYEGKTIPEEFEEEVTEEETKDKPLKLKKFLNALHSVTLVNPESVPEDMDSFRDIFVRLQAYESGKKSEELTAKYIIDTIVKWGNYYVRAVSLSDFYFYKGFVEDKFKENEFDREAYILSTLSTAKNLPMMMRAFYLLDKGRIDSAEIRNLFGAVNRLMLYPEIFSIRTDSNEKNSYKNIVQGDRVLLAMKNKKEVTTIEQVIYRLAGKDLYQEMRDFFGEGKDGEISEKILNYQYNSRFSKAMLVIDYDNHQRNGGTPNSVLKMEMEARNKAKENGGNGATRTAFEVEHLVAQNIDGGFGKYGFDTASISTVRNMMLLEGYLNAEAGNKSPSDKEETWGKSVLNDYYRGKIQKIMSRPGEGYSQNDTEEDGSGERALIESIKGYMKLAPDPQGGKVGELPFLTVRYESGIVAEILDVMTIEDCKACKDKNIVTYFLDGNCRMDRCPQEEKSQEPGLVAMYYLDGNKNIKLDDAKGVDYRLGYLVERFLDCWKEEKGEKGGKRAIIDFLTDTEGVLKGNFKENDKYNSQLLHTVGFRRLNESSYKNNGFDLWLKTDFHKKSSRLYGSHDRGDYPFENAGPEDIEYNYAFNAEAITRQLEKLYKAAELNFPFWVELSQAKYPHQLDGGRGVLMTPYYNVGRKEEFRKWVVEKKSDQDSSSKIEPIYDKYCCETSYFEARKAVLGGLTGNDYAIPEYQREYVWDEKNWDEIWNLIISFQKEKKSLNLGVIILCEDDGKKKIVDGQQRLTTLGLLLDGLAGANSDSVIERIRNSESKLPQKVTDDFKKWIGGKEGKEGVGSWMKENISFTQLTIQGAPSNYQYEVFTAVNGKGKKLTLEEKVKNHLLSKLVGSDRKEEMLGYLITISRTEGFLKAYVEMKRKCAVGAEMLYAEMKKLIREQLEQERESGKKTAEGLVEEIYQYCIAYRIVLGIEVKQKVLKDDLRSEDWIWLRMYQVLRNVHTADAFLMDKIYNYLYNDGDRKDTINAVKKIVLIYFLLYTMDRSGNDKKSVNAKIPKIVGAKSDDIIIKLRQDEEPVSQRTNNVGYEKVVTSIFGESERGILKNSACVYKTIWDDYVRTVDLIDGMSRETARFVLYLIEYWCRKDKDKIGGLDRIIKEDVAGTEIPELEHIWPASKDKDPNAKELAINWLENICLLEKNINICVGDCYLYEEKKGKGKRKGKGKLQFLDEDEKICLQMTKKGRTTTYGNSSFELPQMFYIADGNGLRLNGNYFCIDQNNGNFYYTKAKAEIRMEDLWAEMGHHFAADFGELFGE